MIEFDATPYCMTQPAVSFSSNETDIINHEIAKLLSKGIIETTSHNSEEVVSNIFITPKKDGSHRLILNLKGLNQFVTYHPFKMDTLYSMLTLDEKNCYMASLDLKHAYYSVAVQPSHKKYLRFLWKKRSLSVHMISPERRSNMPSLLRVSLACSPLSL